MNLFDNSDFSPTTKDAEKAMSLPLGLSSPLWFAFAGVATAGVAYWWMTRWTSPVNIEAGEMVPAAEPVFAEAAPVYEPAPPASEPVVEAAAETAEAVVEAMEEAAETVAQAFEAVEPIAEAAIEAAPAVADDLTRLVGIGPRLAASLAERGVTRFAQIADWGADELALYDKQLDLKGRAVRDAWVAQAKRFAEV